MEPDRFRRLMDLVGDATERAEPERSRWLAEQCADDPEMLAEAKSLLEGDSPSLDALTDRLHAGVARAAAQATQRATPMPARIGPYAITQVLGEGGMGIVYGARQEAPLRRDVAIKVVRAGAHAPSLIARFEAERRTLASIDHPNVAHIFDAGTTAEGLPYFVMEWVRGEPITKFCDSRGLGLEQRLRLFQDVLSAVQYAHQKAVVHRDLKPSNVLVTDADGRPTVKVIDFGVAKVTSLDSDMSTAHTTRGAIVGTLEYMSPEQAIGLTEGVDTRSDVYSLGVLLYELLTGELPFAAATLRSASPAELERLFRDTDPPAPSKRVVSTNERSGERASARATDPNRLVRALRGDLDNIVGMAMRKEPARRYASVAQFNEDVDRYLEGRPVVAHPATFGYRARRFIGRHKLEVFGSTTAAVLLIAVTTAFTVRLATARDRATLEAEKSAQVAGFLQGIFEVPDPASAASRDVSARTLLDQGAARIATELTGQPAVQAAMMRVMGRTYVGLGLYPEAARLFEQALALQRSVYGDRDAEIATTLYHLGNARVSIRPAEGEQALRESIAMRSELLGPDDTASATAMTALSMALRLQGKFDEAEQMARRAVDVERVGRPESRELSEALHNLAFVLRAQNREREAEPLYREALAMRRRVFDPSHPSLLMTMSNLAVLLETRGEYAEAEALVREALARRRERLGTDHAVTLNSISNLATHLFRTGKFTQAEEAFREAVAVGRRVHGGDHGNLAIMINNLGVVTRRAGELRESEALHREALAMNRRLNAQPRIAGDMDNLGRVLLARGDVAGAVRMHQDAMALRIKLVGADNVDVAESMAALGDARLAQGNLADAESWLRKALALRTAKLTANDPRLAQSQFDLATALRARGQHAEAERLLRQSLEIRTTRLGAGHPDVAATQRELGAVFRVTNRFREADSVLTDSRRRAFAVLGAEHPDTRKIDREIEVLRRALPPR